MTGRNFLSGPPGELAATIAATTPRMDYRLPPPSGAAERALDGEPDGVIAVDEEGVAYQRIDSGWYMSGAPSRYTSRYLARMGARVVWRAEAATT